MDKNKINDKIKKLETQLEELKQEVNKKEKHPITVEIENRIHALKCLNYKPKAIYVNGEGANELANLCFVFSQPTAPATYKGIPIFSLFMDERVIVGF